MSLNVKFINPFISAACRVLEMETGLEVRRGQVCLQKSGTTSKQVTVALGVTGDVTGAVFYGFSEATCRAIVSKMLGEPVPIFDGLAESAIGEMGNVITGLATTELEREGFVCHIAPPTVVTGRGVYISTLDFHRLVMPLETDIGEVEINVALKDCGE
ncbi:MAG: chemotaxis protein CheX [Bacillota bacterium]